MAAPAVGTKIQFYNVDLAAPAWEVLSEVTDISGPDFTKEEIETTALDTAGGFKTFIGGLKDGGNLTLETNYTRKAFSRMFNIFKKDGNAGVYWFAIILNDTSTADDKSTFWMQASVSQTPIRASAGDRVTSTVTLRTSGEPKLGLAGGAARTVDTIVYTADEVLPADPTA